MSINDFAKPLISIGITCYREEDWLRECWESVLAQTDPRWEAVMVLDGNADQKTKEIFDSFNHPKLRKHNLQQNVGPYLCRTLAIMNSRTGWYAHLDGDDKLPENAISLILEAIEKHPEADFVFGDDIHFGEGMEEETITHNFSPENLIHGMHIQGTAAFQKYIFYLIGGYHIALLYGGADWDFWISVAERNFKGYKAKGITYKRRRRPGSVSKNRRFGVDKVANIVVERHPDFFSVGDRKNQCLGKANATLAKNYKSIGKRKLAAEYAEKSIKFGYDFGGYQEIMREYQMNPIRYFIRRLGRKLQ